jgi:hypothetical protein
LRRLAAAVPREHALAVCQRKARPGLLHRIITRALAGPTPHIAAPRIELLWIPTHLLTFELSARKGPGQVVVSIDACSASFAIANVEKAEDAPTNGPMLPVLVSVETAEQVARKNLVRSILAQRGHRDRPTPGRLLAAECIGWPVWTYYFPRYGRWVDLAGCDALTGNLIGNQMRTGILHGLVAEREQAEQATPK